MDHLSETTTLSRRRLATTAAVGTIATLNLAPLAAIAAQDDPAATPDASPSASPVANTHPAPPTAAILPEYQDLSASIKTLGQSVLDPLLQGDSAPAEAILSTEAKQALANVDLVDVVASLQHNQLRFSYVEVGAHFVATVSDGLISGFFQQGGTRDVFTLTPETASTPGATPATAAAAATPAISAYPTGTWSGLLKSLQIPLGITFTGTADQPTATITIAPQSIVNVPLGDVAFVAEAPIGAVIQERAIPLQPDEPLFGQVREWAGATIEIDLTFANDELTSIQFQPAIILPPDPASDHVSDITYHLPWHEGAWFIFWGGPTEFQNYHTVAPAQRHALDIVIWQDGGTHTGDGTHVEDYFVWGQPLIAPAAGTVVEVFNTEPEQVPGSPLSATNPDAFKTLHPAGNHVVIQTAKEEFVYLAHMQTGSIVVEKGDTVQLGDAIGLVGNSGNTSEPHLHIHIQNVADFFNPSAVGIPLAFSDVLVDGKPEQDASLVQGTFVEPAMS